MKLYNNIIVVPSARACLCLYKCIAKTSNSHDPAIKIITDGATTHPTTLHRACICLWRGIYARIQLHARPYTAASTITDSRALMCLCARVLRTRYKSAHMHMRAIIISLTTVIDANKKHDPRQVACVSHSLAHRFDTLRDIAHGTLYVAL